jgi:Transcription initiation factor IID, 18kD subunit
VARTRGGKLPTEKDLLFVLRKDQIKYQRVLHLLRMNEELKAQRKALNHTDFSAFTL